MEDGISYVDEVMAVSVDRRVMQEERSHQAPSTSE